jgi:hypothetical protein
MLAFLSSITFFPTFSPEDSAISFNDIFGKSAYAQTQPSPVTVWQGDAYHVTTRPHNRKLVYDPNTGNYFAFFGIGTDSDGRDRNRWKSSGNGVTWTSGGQAYYEGTGHSSSQDALYDGDKIVYLYFRYPTSNDRTYSVKTFTIDGLNLIDNGAGTALMSWTHPGSGGFYGSLTKDSLGYYWTAVRLVDWAANPVEQKTGIFRSTNPNDPTSFQSSPDVLTPINYDGNSVPDVIALDNGQVIVISKQETDYWLSGTKESELLVSLYLPGQGWQPTYTLLGGSDISNRIRTVAEFDHQTQTLHLFYGDTNGNLRHLTLSSQYGQSDWSSKPGTLVSSGMNPNDEQDISMCLDFKTNPAGIYAAYLNQNRYKIRYHDGSSWGPEQPFGDQGSPVNEVSMLKDCSHKVAALYLNTNNLDIYFQEYIPATCPDVDDDGYEDKNCGGQDCDDSNPNVNPDATEICSGGEDEDCDGDTDCLDPDCASDPSCSAGCQDIDGDGYDDQACGGTDCLDSDPNVNPGETEICSGGVDEDCDGDEDCQDPDCTASCSSNCNGLVLLHHYDYQAAYGETSTHVHDFSENGNDGTVSGATWDSSGRFGGAFDFNGLGNKIAIPDNPSINPTDWTIGGWFKYTAAISRLATGTGIAKSDPTNRDYLLSINNFDGICQIRIGSNSCSATGPANSINHDEWTHIICAYDRSADDLRLYINGTLADQQTCSIKAPDNVFTLSIGSRTEDTTQGFTGLIDEISVWNRTLSQPEIESLAKSDIALSCASPCPDNNCDPGECSTCPEDCTVSDCCGIDGCNTVVGEDCRNCQSDCSPCPCLHVSEVAPCDECVDIDEIMFFIGDWKQGLGAITMTEVMDGIGLYRSGQGCP